jgi:hypothetical protein
MPLGYRPGSKYAAEPLERMTVERMTGIEPA